MDLRPESATPLTWHATQGRRAETGLAMLPEDVAALYSWAHLPDARYRDFSAARREARAHTRLRAAVTRWECARRAREAAEQAARETEQLAQLAEIQARHHDALARRALGEGRPADAQAQEQAREAALREAGSLLEAAAQQSLEASRQAQAEQAAQIAARQEEREMAEAHASAERQTRQYLEGTAVRSQAAAGHKVAPHITHRSLTPASGYLEAVRPPSPMQPERFPSRRARLQPVLAEALALPSGRGVELPSAAQTAAPPSTPRAPQTADLQPGSTEQQPPLLQPWESSGKAVSTAFPSAQAASLARGLSAAPAMQLTHMGEQHGVPAWLREDGSEQVPATGAPHVASWPQVPGLLTQGSALSASTPTPALPVQPVSPLFACFSLEEATAPSSFAADLGYALSAGGPAVLLAEAHGGEAVPSLVRIGNPRQGTPPNLNSPLGGPAGTLTLWHWQRSAADMGPSGAAALERSLTHARAGFACTVVDLQRAARTLLGTVLRLGGTVLVPLLPDARCLARVREAQRLLHRLQGRAEIPVQVYFVLVQFDAAAPGHRALRDQLRAHLQGSLAPCEIRRVAVATQALPPGQALFDAPPSPILAADYRALAVWLGTLGPSLAASGPDPRFRT